CTRDNEYTQKEVSKIYEKNIAAFLEHYAC
ncbi:unnamed protein product, partial [marine sediment metagenome]